MSKRIRMLVDFPRSQTGYKSIVGLLLTCLVAGSAAFASDAISRKQLLQQKIANGYHHGIPKRHLRDLSESDIPILIELSEDPANARNRWQVFVAMSHIKNEKVHQFLKDFYIENFFSLIDPPESEEQLWLATSIHIIPSALGRLAQSRLDTSFDFLCQLSQPNTNLSLLDPHELSKRDPALARQELFNNGIHGLANCHTRNARTFLGDLVESGDCKDYRFTHGESYQSYAKRTLQTLTKAYYKRLVLWAGGCLTFALLLTGLHRYKNRQTKPNRN